MTASEREATRAGSTSRASAQELRRLLEAITAVGHELDLGLVLRQTVAAAQELVGARYAALGVLDPTGTHLAEFITVGLDEATAAAIGARPKGHGLLGLLITDPTPIRLTDLSEHPMRHGLPLNHPPMTSFLGVPVRIRGQVFGNLYLSDKVDGSSFSDIDEELVKALAVSAAAAIESASLHQLIGAASLDAARERISKDLQDRLIRRLFATGLDLHATASQLPHDPDVVARLQRHVDDLDSMINEIRSSVWAIERAPATMRVREMILRAIAVATELLGFEPVVQFHGRTDLLHREDLTSALLATLREFLTSVAQGSGATQVTVTIRVDSELSVEICDDGPGQAHLEQRSLTELTRRAKDLDGHCTLSTTQPAGSTLRWTVPLRRPSPSSHAQARELDMLARVAQ